MKILRIFSLVLALFLGSALQAQAAKTIKLAHPNVPSHPMGQGYELFKKDLEERSKGRI